MWELPRLFDGPTPKETMLAAYSADHIGTAARRFSRDKEGSSPGAKDFLITTDEDVFNNSYKGFLCGKPQACYEYYLADDHVALKLDLDILGADEGFDCDGFLLYTVGFFGTTFHDSFGKELSLSDWIVERTDYDPDRRKHSFHLKETKYSFASMKGLKRFLEGSKADAALLEFLKKKGCDTNEKPLDCSIYREGGLRLLYSSKLGKNRPLYPYEVVDAERGLKSQMPEADRAGLFDFWVASKITHVEGYEEVQVPDRVRSVHVSPSQSTPDQMFVVALIHLIAVGRWDDYDFWLRMLLCLRALGDEYRAIFLRASSQSSKFDAARDPKKWDTTASKGHIGIGTLHYYAKMDSPEGYKELIRAHSTGDVELSVESDGAHFSIAKVLVSMMPGVIKNVEEVKMRFYNFDNHRWNRGGSKRMSLFLSSEVHAVYAQLLCDAKDLLGQAQGKDAKQEAILQARVKTLSRICCDLKHHGFKDSVIKEVAVLTYDPHFMDILDENHSLIGFENGVYDLEAGAFRAGLPDDAVSLSTKYDFAMEDDMEVQQQIHDFLDSCLESSEVKTYMLRVIASALYGRNVRERFFVFKGTGGNGKGVLFDLLEKTFGGYYGTLDSEFFTKTSRNSGQATPELADKKGKRIVLASEQDDNEKFQVKRIKLVSGGDEVSARMMRENPIYFRPQFTLFLATNEAIAFSKMDRAIMRRLEVFDFPYSFVEHPDPCNDNEKQIDQQLKEEKVGGALWRQQMMRMLTAIYAQGIVTTSIPSAVLQASQDAFDNSNPIKSWHDECVTHTQNDRDAYTPADLYELYCGVKGGSAVPEATFWSSLAMNNIIQKRSNGKRLYVRIKVLSQSELDAQAAFEAFRMGD